MNVRRLRQGSQQFESQGGKSKLVFVLLHAIEGQHCTVARDIKHGKALALSQVRRVRS